MLNFLFWNINRKPIASLVARLARERGVDILVLAECDIEPMQLLRELNASGRNIYFFSPDYSDRFVIFTRFSSEWLEPLRDQRNLSVKRLIHPLFADLILGIVHLPSKLHLNDQEQAILATRLRNTINEIEDNVGHSRTLIFGDFNMNPFEAGMMSSESIHAVMDKRTAQEGSRVVHSENRPFFYNPMWSMMGDLSKGPSGTYYYRESSPIAYFWNMLDQVVLRPSLLPFFRSDSLDIVTDIASQSLLRDDGRPDAVNASHHLPLFFRFEFQMEGET